MKKKRGILALFENLQFGFNKRIDKVLGNKTFDKVSKELLLKKYNKHSGIKIKQVMQKPVLISPSTKKKELYSIAVKNPHAKIFFVVDKKKKLLGSVHEDDLFVMFVPNEFFESVGLDLALDLEEKFFAKTAKELMRKTDISCYENDDIFEVALTFLQIEANEMAVLNKQDRIVGVITQGILVRHLGEGA